MMQQQGQFQHLLLGAAAGGVAAYDQTAGGGYHQMPPPHRDPARGGFIDEGEPLGGGGWGADEGPGGLSRSWSDHGTPVRHPYPQGDGAPMRYHGGGVFSVDTPAARPGQG